MLTQNVNKMQVYQQIKSVNRCLDESQLEKECFFSTQGQHKKHEEGLDSIELKQKFKAEIKRRIVTRKHFSTTDLTKWVNKVLSLQKVENEGNVANHK